MRLPVAADVHAQLSSACSDLAMAASDWPCRVSPTQTDLAYGGGSLLIWLGLALPGVVLAASGRRLSAVVPVGFAGLAAALVVATFSVRSKLGSLFGVSDMIFGSGDSNAYWITHRPAAFVLDTVLALIPAIAIAFVLRPARRPRPQLLPRPAVWLATFTLAGAIVALRWVLSRAPCTSRTRRSRTHG